MLYKYYNKYKQIRALSTDQNQSEVQDKQSKLNKSLYVPRDKIDHNVNKLASIGKQVNNIKAILTQRKIKKQGFDLNRVLASLNSIEKNLFNVLKYSEKASVVPKLKVVESVEEKSPPETSASN
jgi:tetrahydromethanopterin S-methyltransferase subunit G